MMEKEMQHLQDYWYEHNSLTDEKPVPINSVPIPKRKWNDSESEETFKREFSEFLETALLDTPENVIHTMQMAFGKYYLSLAVPDLVKMPLFTKIVDKVYPYLSA